MAKLSIPAVAVFAAVLATAASAQTRPIQGSGEEGFFRPARDPALTSIEPPPAAPSERAAAPASQPPAAAAVEVVDAAREAEADANDRLEAQRAAAHAAAKAPAITSPLDGSAPIVSPLDGTAPIISPVGR